MNGEPLAPGTVLGLAGSPRRHGNSERLLDAYLEGVVEAGAPAVKLPVVEHGIGPCRGCYACSSTGECVVRDGMQDVYPLVDSAAAMVVATPVFFATVPAVLKALYDRFQPYWARRYELGEPPAAKRPADLLVVRGGPDPFGYECAVTTTKSALAVAGFRLGEPHVLQGLDEPAEMARHAATLATVRERGRLFGAALKGTAVDS